MHEAQTLNQLSMEAMVKGSKTFSLAAKFFPRSEFESATRIYFWCRHCDDVIDDQQSDHEVLAELKNKTFISSVEPQFAGFRQTCEKYQIPNLYPSELLEGMRMDIENKPYETMEDLKIYCYRVAGTVGLMMSHVMGIFNEEALPQAAKLGMGMQLTNICRDIKEDFERGRIYLPQEYLTSRSVKANELLEKNNRKKLFEIVTILLQEAEELYSESSKGINDLPLKSALAVTMALHFYREIGREILRRGPSAIDSRVVVSKSTKISLMLKSLIQVILGVPKRLLRSRQIIQIEKTWSPG